MMNSYYKIIENKGGHVLKNRTTVKGVCIGDTFCFQEDTGNFFKVLFFFKDKFFNAQPMVFGLNKIGNGTVLCSIDFVKIMKKQEQKHIKRKRRK